MGVEDWESKYKGRGKPQLSDFIDDEGDNMISQMTKPYPVPSSPPTSQSKMHSGFHPPTYLEGYETIDRRRNKKIMDPGGLSRKETTKKEREETCQPDFALFHEKRGEVLIRHIPEMLEEEEHMTSGLRPYKDELLYKTRMWAKNDLDNTLKNYVAYKNDHGGMQVQFDFKLENSRDSKYSPLEQDLDAFMLEDYYLESARHYKKQCSSLDEGHIEYSQGLHEKKCAKSQCGGWMSDAMLSPVEEPSDEYVDTMDELQCLVETVSEYLAEKEEEISKYGSLPKSSKSRSSSQGSNRTDSFRLEPISSKETKTESPNQAPPDQNVLGIKHAMSSLLSSLTDKVGGGLKQPSLTPQAPTAQPSQSGLTRLLSFIPKSNNTAPVAIVSPVESSPEKSFSYLPSQLLQTKTQSHQEMGKATKSQTQPCSRGQTPELGAIHQSAPGNLALGKLNNLKRFSAEDKTANEYKQKPEFKLSQEHIQSDVKCTDKNVHLSEKSKTSENTVKSIPVRISLHDQPLSQNYGKPNSGVCKQENLQVPEPQSCTNQTANTGFFSPLKKSLNSLISPVSTIPTHRAPPVAVYPVFRNKDEPQLDKPVEDPSLSSKPKQPFISCENVSLLQRPKAEEGMLSSFMKFSSTEDNSASMKMHSNSHGYHDSSSSSSTTLSHNSAMQQENTERRWFSSIFKPPSASTGLNQNHHHHHNYQSQDGKMPFSTQYTSTLKTVASHGMHHQSFSEPESECFNTSPFKCSSTEDISHIDSNSPKQGLLSGLLKFGSNADLSGNVPQQASNQCPRFNNASQLPHHSSLQQSSTTPQKGGLLSGLLKFSSSDTLQQKVQSSEADKQRNIYSSYPEQQQISGETLQTQPQQKGLLSGLLKFASSDNSSNSQTIHKPSSVHHNQQDNSMQNIQVPSGGLPLNKSTFSQQRVQQETCKPSVTRQQTVPLQQCQSQQGGFLSGLFKFASADNLNTQNQSSMQQHGISQSKSSHEQTRLDNIPILNQNQPKQNQMQSSQVSGLFSGLFKSASENLTQQQHENTYGTQTSQHIKVPHTQACPTQVETASQSGMLSGLFNKLTTSEGTHTSCQKSAGHTPQQTSASSTITMQTLLPNHSLQLVSNSTQPSSQEHVEKVKATGTAKQGFLSGLFGKNVSTDSCTNQETKSQHLTPSSKVPQLTSDVLKYTISDCTMDKLPRSVAESLNPEQRRHALIRVPESIHSESLDLRTSTAFARSLQSQATQYSFSTGNLSQLHSPHSLLSTNPVTHSTGNIHSYLQTHTTSPIMTLPFICGSSPSLCGATNQNPYQGHLTDRGISPTYDENQWIRESVLWQQFQNESLSYHLQGYQQNCEGMPLPTAALHSSYLNNNQQVNHSPWQAVASNQKQMESYQFEGHRHQDSYTKIKTWSSDEDLESIAYTPNMEGVLNLTTNQSNPNFRKQHSFNDGSSYSLNGVSYYEDFYEETVPSLSYSANWQYGVDNENLQNSHIDCTSQYGHFISNRPANTNPALGVYSETEDSLYLEDTEWYQQWLALLEQGMWWPAEDCDCGYFVYTDHEFIYALLTDALGEYVYVCTPEGDSWEDAQTLDSLPSAWLHNEMVLVCGFKIPLYNEDELLWLPGQGHNDSQLLNAPLDLSDAFRKGNQIMNLNLTQFSEMFENSFLSQEQQGVDFSSYRLNKVRMDSRQSSYGYEDYCQDAIDLSCHNRDHMGPCWNNYEVKRFLAEKVSVSLNSSCLENSNNQLLYNCYQPIQKRRSSTAVTVKHVDDVSEEEWRKRVSLVEEKPNCQVNKMSPLISSFVGKSSQGELNKTSMAHCDQTGKHTKNILSTSFQNIKSKILKEESVGVVTQQENAIQQMQKPATIQERILPTAPASTQMTLPSTVVRSSSQKPRLSRQSTMAQQAAPPTKPNVAVSVSSTGYLNKPTHHVLSVDKPETSPVQKSPEQPEAGLTNFIKSAVGVVQTKPNVQAFSQASTCFQSKNGSSASDSAIENKESTRVSNLFGSVSSLFSNESSQQQKSHMKPNFSESSLSSASRAKGISRQQTMDQSGPLLPIQSQTPTNIITDVSSVNSYTGPAISKSEIIPPMNQTNQEAGTKPSGGLFGFSVGDLLVGSVPSAQSATTPQTPATASQEDSFNKSIFSLFTGSSPQQAAPKTESMTQPHPPSAAQQPHQQDLFGKSLLSMFGGSSPTQPPNQSRTNTETKQHGTVPPKGPSSLGFLSMFSGPSSQQSQAQTGSFLGGILPGSSSSSENQTKGFFSVFSDSITSQTQPPTMPSHQTVAQTKQQLEPHTQSKPQEQSQPQGQRAASAFGGILGGLSSSSENPMNNLFSMFSAPTTPQPQGISENANLSSASGTAASKLPTNNIVSVFNNVTSLPQQQSPNLATSMNESKQQRSPQMSSDLSRQMPEQTNANELQNEVSGTKASSVSNKLHASPSSDNTVVGTSTNKEDVTIKGIYISFKEPQSESINLHKETSKVGTTQNLAPKEFTASTLSMFSGSSPHPPSSARIFSEDPGKSLPSLFSTPSTEPAKSQSGSLPASSGLNESPATGIFSGFGCSLSQPSPQSGSSLLGTIFGGTSSQTPAPLTGGSFLSGLFGGSAPQTASQVGPTKTGKYVPQPAGSEAGSSLFGSLFSGSAPQAAGSQTGTSILSGIFGGSLASSIVTQTSGSTLETPNNNSGLGRISERTSSLTATAETITNNTMDKVLLSVTEKSAPCSIPTVTNTLSNNGKMTFTTTVTDTSADQSVLPKSSNDGKTATSSAEMSVIETAVKTKDQEETEQPVSTVEASVSSTKDSTIIEVKSAALVEDNQSNTYEISTQFSKHISCQSLDIAPPKVEEKTVSLSISHVGQIEQKPLESNKSSKDSSSDTVTGFMSSLFKPAAASTETPQLQQQNSLMFGLGGVATPASSSQTGTSLLGGIFGGTNNQSASLQTGGSLLGGLIKGPATQSSPQTTTTSDGGSILGGIFGGGSSAKSAGTQSGGSLLSGMFGGAGAASQSSGSLLGGMFGGSTGQVAGSQVGASILGGIGGSLFGGMGQSFKPSDSVADEPKTTSATSSQSRIKNENALPKETLSGCDSNAKEIIHIQIKPDNLTLLSEEACLRITDVTSEPVNSTDAMVMKKICTEEEKTGLENEVTLAKPIAIKGDPESKENDKSDLSVQKEPDINRSSPCVQLPSSAEQPQAKSLFGFMSTKSDARKSLGSFFAPSIPQVVSSVPQSEGGNALFSGLKSLSESLLQEKNPVTGKQEATASLFGAKISFPWQAETPNLQVSPVTTTQSQFNDKPTSDQRHTVQKSSTSDPHKTELVGCSDVIENPQICIFTPDVDPSASLTLKENERLVETHPSPGSTVGVQLDNQSKKDLLNEKRLVKA